MKKKKLEGLKSLLFKNEKKSDFYVNGGVSEVMKTTACVLTNPTSGLSDDKMVEEPVKKSS